jgi:hypothetical protein
MLKSILDNQQNQSSKYYVESNYFYNSNKISLIMKTFKNLQVNQLVKFLQ